MTKTLKVAIVGAGIGASHIAAYQSLGDRFSVEALCDIDTARAEKVAGRLAVPRIVESFERLLTSGLDLDIIDICTPSSLHFAQAVAAVRAGFHVVVEKPFASSLAEADALAELEAQSDRRVCPIFQYRFSDGITQLLHLKERGLVAKCYSTTVETHWRRLPDYYDNPWRGRWATELGGCLTTHAIHAHDILTYVLGPIASVFAKTRTLVNQIETEDCAAIVLEMADGSLATLSVTLGSEEEISRFRFYFDGLTVESNHSPYNPGTAPWRFICADPERQKVIDAAVAEAPTGPEQNAGQFIRLHHALTEGGPLPVTIADARRSLELLTAAYYSSRTGQEVRLPLSRDHELYGGWLAPR
ncbi:MAG: Gfo/Idh/MocA family protein [Dehalococcoidia bacterium]